MHKSHSSAVILMTDEDLFEKPPPFTAPTLRCKVSSDLNELNRLNAIYPWIPNSEQVRPPPELIEQKNIDMAEVHSRWMCSKDYIYHKVFDKQFFVRNDKYVVFDKELSHLPKVFKKNEYPYQTQGRSVTGNHSP